MEERNFEAEKYKYKTFRLNKPPINSLLVLVEENLRGWLRERTVPPWPSQDPNLG
jgi:hypothetical protein